MKKEELREFIINELGGLKTIHIGTPKSVINRQFIYEQDIDRLVEKLTPISPSPTTEKRETFICPNCGQVEEYTIKQPKQVTDDEKFKWFVRGVTMSECDTAFELDNLAGSVMDHYRQLYDEVVRDLLKGEKG